MIETRIVDKYGEPKVEVHEREVFDGEARLAVALIEKWGLVAAVDDGEDSTGRHKLRLSTPEELVSRAFTVAKLTCDTARERGLIHLLPSVEEITAEGARMEAEREERRRPKTN